MKRLIPLILIISIFTILAAGCAVEAEPEITPAMILAGGVTHMASLPGFEFSITQVGPEVFLDADQVGYIPVIIV